MDKENLVDLQVDFENGIAAQLLYMIWACDAVTAVKLENNEPGDLILWDISEFIQESFTNCNMITFLK